jgi:hypothetical protein
LVALLGAAIVVLLGGRAWDVHAVADRSIAWVGVFAVAGTISLWFLLAPLGRRSPSLGLRTVLIGSALALPLIHALSGSVAHQSNARTDASFAEQAFACFSYGLFLTLPFLIVLMALERSDRPWLKILTGAGAMAGLVANAALALHCLNSEPGHLAVGHATIGAALFGVGVFVALFRTRTA